MLDLSKSGESQSVHVLRKRSAFLVSWDAVGFVKNDFLLVNFQRLFRVKVGVSLVGLECC